jgi:hypothetical protein
VFFGECFSSQISKISKKYSQGCKEQEGEKRGPKPKLKFKAHIIIVIIIIIINYYIKDPNPRVQISIHKSC